LSTARFRYVGDGDVFFPDFHWKPAPGEERELPAETSSPLLERLPDVEPIKPARKETP
jgi:hypothetical protein